MKTTFQLEVHSLEHAQRIIDFERVRRSISFDIKAVQLTLRLVNNEYYLYDMLLKLSGEWTLADMRDIQLYTSRWSAPIQLKCKEVKA